MTEHKMTEHKTAEHKTAEHERAHKKPDIRDKALSLLEKRDKTEYQLRLALSKAGYKESEIDDTLRFLVESGYVDDDAFARRYLEILIEKGRGRRRAADEMRRHGLPSESVSFMIEDEYPLTLEKKNARLIALKVLAGLPRDAAAALISKRIALKLTAQGYSFETIDRVIYEAIHERESLEYENE